MRAYLDPVDESKRVRETWGLVFRVQGLGFRVWGLRCGVLRVKVLVPGPGR